MATKRKPIRFSRYSGNSDDKEKNNGISLTIPDQSYSVREILTKFAQGTLPDIYKQPEFSDDMPDIRGLDISEIHEMKKNSKQNIKELKETHDKLEEELKNLPKELNPINPE